MGELYWRIATQNSPVDWNLSMNHLSAAVKKNLICSKGGFTLIELLVVCAIVAILVAIAIPQFATYRARGFDTQMKSDVKNVAIAMEAYYSERHVYPPTPADLVNFGFQNTQGVTLVINVTTPTTFTVTGSKPGGTQPSFTYDSVTGQTS